MSATPRVSVVAAHQDGADWAPALAGVAAQTCADLELVLVGAPASTDLPPRLQARVVRVDAPAGATSAAQLWNAGVAAARGALVTFLEPADRWTVERLELQLAALEQAPQAAGCLCSALVAFGEETCRVLVPQPQWRAHPVQLAWLLATQPWGWCLRRELLQQLGGFDPALGLLAPAALLARVAQSGALARVERPLLVRSAAPETMEPEPGDARPQVVAWQLQVAHDLEALLATPAVTLPADARAAICAFIGEAQCRAGDMAAGRTWLRRAAGEDAGSARLAATRALATLGRGALIGTLAFARRWQAHLGVALSLLLARRA
jgi:hypothetical protein